MRPYLRTIQASSKGVLSLLNSCLKCLVRTISPCSRHLCNCSTAFAVVMHSVTQMLTELVIYQLFNVCQYANAFVNYLARLNS